MFGRFPRFYASPPHHEPVPGSRDTSTKYLAGGREGDGMVGFRFRSCVCVHLLMAGWLGGETRQGLKSSSFVQSDIYGIDGAGQC